MAGRLDGLVTDHRGAPWGRGDYRAGRRAAVFRQRRHGRFSFHGLKPGPYLVRAPLPGVCHLEARAGPGAAGPRRLAGVLCRGPARPTPTSEARGSSARRFRGRPGGGRARTRGRGLAHAPPQAQRAARRGRRPPNHGGGRRHRRWWPAASSIGSGIGRSRRHLRHRPDRLAAGPAAHRAAAVTHRSNFDTPGAVFLGTIPAGIAYVALGFAGGPLAGAERPGGNRPGLYSRPGPSRAPMPPASPAGTRWTWPWPTACSDTRGPTRWRSRPSPAATATPATRRCPTHGRFAYRRA